MHKGYKGVREMVKHYPLALLSLTDKNLINAANAMLPYSVGIEIEINKPTVFYTAGELNHLLETKYLRSIGIIHIAVTSDEARFRIPPGIKGMVALYKLTQYLKRHAQLNILSGLHYHIDFTDVVWTDTSDYAETLPNIVSNQFMNNIQLELLKALDSWGYKGFYNSRRVSYMKQWVKFHRNYKTMEVRIGEMTFDYDLIIKRILHLQNLSRILKKHLLPSQSVEGRNMVKLLSDKRDERIRLRQAAMRRQLELDSFDDDDHRDLFHEYGLF